MPEQQPTQGQWFLKPSRYGLTPANGVTALRLVLVPFIAIALLDGRYEHAFWMTAIAGASDAVDGYMARAFGHQSLLGAYLDPAADKLLIISVFGILTWQGHVPLWLTALVLARDLVLAVSVAIVSRLNKAVLRIKPLFVSKVTTFVLIVLVLATLADLAFGLGLVQVRLGLCWLAAGFTIVSWVGYYFEGLRALRTANVTP